MAPIRPMILTNKRSLQIHKAIRLFRIWPGLIKRGLIKSTPFPTAGSSGSCLDWAKTREYLRAVEFNRDYLHLFSEQSPGRISQAWGIIDVESTPMFSCLSSVNNYSRRKLTTLETLGGSLLNEKIHSSFKQISSTKGGPIKELCSVSAYPHSQH